MSRIHNSDFNYFFDTALVEKETIEKKIIHQINLNDFGYKKDIRSKYVKEYFLKLFFLKNTKDLNLIYKKLVKNKNNTYFNLFLNFLKLLIYSLFSSLYLLRFFIYFLDFFKKNKF